MIFGLSTGWMIVLMIVVAATGAGLGSAYVRNRTDKQPEPIFREHDTKTGKLFSKRPVHTEDGTFGIKHLKAWRHSKKKKKALKKGYVRWHLIGDSVSEERLVKPEYEDGGNIPELEFEGGTYLFPEKAMLPCADDGVYMVMHREGEAEPIDLRAGNEHTIGANTLKEYLTLRVTGQKPGMGMLGDWDAQTLMKYGLLALVGYFILQEVMAGGVF